MTTEGNSLIRSFSDYIEGPRFDGLRGRDVRRRLVVSFYLVVLVIPPVAIWSGSDVSSLLLLAISMLIGMALGIAVRGIADKPDGYLDERQLQLRNAAYFRAYWICAVIAVASAAGMARVWQHDQVLGYAVFVSLVMLITVQPTLMLAWVLPDDDDED